MIRRLLATGFFVASFVGQVQAAELVLTYDGVTGAGSSLNGTAIDVGTVFEIRSVFSDTNIAFLPSPGVGIYAVLSSTVTVGGVTYSELTSAVDSIQLASPGSLFPNIYQVALIVNGTDFSPEYAAATPPVDGALVAPTVFSDYTGSGFRTSLTFDTDAGTLTVDYDRAIGIAASISAVPEPPSLLLAGTVALVAISMRVHRRW
jgi:hypothetical protein